MSFAGFYSGGDFQFMALDSKWIFGGILAVVVIAAIGMALFKGPPAFASDASPVYYFYRDDCHFCIQQKPILEELAAEGFRVKLMDVNKNPQYWQQYGITGTPTFMNSKTPEDRLSGLQPKDTLKVWLEKSGAKLS